MSNRNFPNFLEAYVEYAHDGFCPDSFHIWTGLSIISGAMERRSWLKQGQVVYHPNTYILLVSHPGSGKSTALDRGVDLLEDLKNTVAPNFKIIPNQITEPGLIEVMKTLSEVYVGPHKFLYSSGYFYASEASASAMQNLCGDFNSTITSFYDCPKVFRKKLKSEKTTTEIPNVCFSVLAGTTFDFLKRLVNDESVKGGLASRFIYVVEKDRKVRESKWGDTAQSDNDTKKKLMQDLWAINKMSGPFKPDPGFIRCWEEGQPEFDRYLIKLDSVRMESIMARRFTNIIKIAMVLSASQSDDMILTEAHWVRASALIDSVVKDNSFVIESAIMADKNSQSGLTQTIIHTINKSGGECSMTNIRAALLRGGNDLMKVENTIKSLISAQQIEYVEGSNMTRVRALVNSDANL